MAEISVPPLVPYRVVLEFQESPVEAEKIKFVK
jgi:hypothetical protein